MRRCCCGDTQSRRTAKLYSLQTDTHRKDCYKRKNEIETINGAKYNKLDVCVWNKRKDENKNKNYVKRDHNCLHDGFV